MAVYLLWVYSSKQSHTINNCGKFVESPNKNKNKSQIRAISLGEIVQV